MRETEIDKTKPYVFIFGQWLNIPPGENYAGSVLVMPWDGAPKGEFLLTTDREKYRVLDGRLVLRAPPPVSLMTVAQSFGDPVM